MKKINNLAMIEELERTRLEYERMQRELVLSKYTLPQAPTPCDSLYRTFVKDSNTKSGRKQISATTLEGLKDKVYAHERSSKYSKCNKTIAEVFEITEDERLKYIKYEEKRLSVKNTIVRNKAAYKRFVAGTPFEKKYITDITKADIEELFFINLSRYNLKKKGVASLKSVIKPIFDLAFQEYWITDNPYSRIDFKKFNNMIIEDTPIEERTHSSEDLEKMLDYIHKKQAGNCKNFFTPYALELQMIVALRRGEVPPLKWTDIDDICLTVRREMITAREPDGSKQEFKIVEHTKTYKNRKYPLTRELRGFLQRLRKAHEEQGIDSPYLFPSNNENGCITNATVYDFYFRMCGVLGIKTSKEFTKGTHAFRRTRITEVTNKSGGNILLASKLFGNSPEIAKKHYYTGLDLDEARRVLES